MAIRFACQCGKKIKLPDESAGRQARCKACGRVLVVPAAPAADRPERFAKQRRAILEHELSWMSRSSRGAGALDKVCQRKARILKSAEVSPSSPWVRVEGDCALQDVRAGGTRALNLVLGEGR